MRSYLSFATYTTTFGANFFLLNFLNNKLFTCYRNYSHSLNEFVFDINGQCQWPLLISSQTKKKNTFNLSIPADRNKLILKLRQFFHIFLFNVWQTTYYLCAVIGFNQLTEVDSFESHFIALCTRTKKQLKINKIICKITDKI